MKPFKGTVETLGHVRDLKMEMWGHCGRDNCGKGRKLDMAKLIARFTEDHEFVGNPAIANAFVCTCGHVGGSITLHGPDRRNNEYAKAKGG